MYTLVYYKYTYTNYELEINNLCTRNIQFVRFKTKMCMCGTHHCVDVQFCDSSVYTDFRDLIRSQQPIADMKTP